MAANKITPAIKLPAPTWLKDPDVQKYIRLLLKAIDERDREISAAINADVVWTEVTSFSNSWVNYGAAHATAAYCKDDHGFVHLRGVIKSGTVDVPAFTLPTEFRPAYQLAFGTISNDAIGRVDVKADGTVSPLFPSNNAWVVLNGITFFAS